MSTSQASFGGLFLMSDNEEVAALKEKTPVPVKPTVTGSWKELIVRWLFDQSVSTVLLVGVVVGLFYYVPKFVVPAIQQGYGDNAESLERAVKMQVDHNASEFKLLLDSHDRDRELLEQLLEVRLRDVRARENENGK